VKSLSRRKEIKELGLRSGARSDKYSPQMMGWSPRSGYQSTRNSYFSQFTYT